MNENIEKGQEGNKVAEVTVGSVTIEIFQSRNSAKVLKKPAQGTSPASPREFEIKYYDSFLVPYYEGSLRKVPRRSTLEKAQKLAKETATRLNKDGARAEFLSERDRRIYFLARVSAAKLGLDVDTACRKLVELQERLKKGTLEQAVDFHNDHGQRVQHGVFNTEIYKQYLEHLEKRGAGEYYLRDVKRYVGGFVAEYPGAISPIQTDDDDDRAPPASIDLDFNRKRFNPIECSRANLRKHGNLMTEIVHNGNVNFGRESCENVRA